MLNLLFIISHPRAGAIMSHLQPQLKIRIDLVADFDHGLKDVFEKRPAIVIIQEQITGVSGDSVARHIQMLLGSSAPTFVLAHEGNPRAKAVKGLFEYLLNLEKDENELFDDVMAVLRTILGDKADSLIIPAKARISEKPVKDETAPQKKVSADELVDVFLSEIEKIETSGVVFEGKAPAAAEAASGVPAVPVVSNTDEMASMLIDAARQAKQQESAPETAPEQKTTVAIDRQAAAAHAAEPAPQAVPLQQISTAESAKAAPIHKPVAESAAVGKPVKPTDAVPEELLQAFEKNYNSCATSWKKRIGIAVAVVVVAAVGGGGWFLRTYKPELLSFGGSNNKSQATSKPAGAPPQPDAARKTAAPSLAGGTVDKAAGNGAPGVKTPAAPTVAAAKPSFVRSGRLDAAYAAQKPGWERYLGKEHDVRIFKADNRIKAVQVIAAKGGTVSSSFLKSVLDEVVGSSEFSMGEREKKEGYRGFLLQRGTLNGKADLVLYRSKKTDAIAAFVVSLN